MSNTPKLILLSHLLNKHGIPRKGTEQSKKFCREVGIEIVQILSLRKSTSILVNEQQGNQALSFWKEQQARKAVREPQLCPDKKAVGSLEERMFEHERLLNHLIAAQNLAADRLTILLKQLGVDPAAACARPGPAS